MTRTGWIGRMVLVLVMCLWCVPVLAQTLTTDKPAEQKLWEVFLKILFPTVWTAVSPYFTKYVTAGLLWVMSSVPASVQVVISSVIGGLLAGMAGAVPDFPLTVESAATMGAAGGATGQLLANMNPQAMQPQPAKTGT